MIGIVMEGNERFHEASRRGTNMTAGRSDAEDAFYARMWAVLRRFPEAAQAMAEALEEEYKKEENRAK